jgi:tyrosine-protein phosphatase SIW14
MKAFLPAAIALAALLAACSNPPDPDAGRTDPSLASPSTLEGVSNFAKISAGVWRGSQPTAEGMATLKHMGVRTIVNLRALHTDRDELRGLGLDYVHLPCTALVPDEDVVVKFLKVATDPARRPVFVHCQYGSDRTGVVIAAYRVAVQGWSMEQAKRELPIFDFHEVFVPLERYLEGFNADQVRQKMETAKVEFVTIP